MCTVIVCTRNRPEQLEECLESLQHQHGKGFEVLVVDNSSGDERTRSVATRSGAHYLVSPEVGLSRARNHALSAAKGKIVAYIDDDAIADPDWTNALMNQFSDPAVAAVMGRTLARPANATEEARRIAGFRAAGQEQEAPLIVDRNTSDWFAITNFGGLGDGNNMAFRRSAFGGAPGFLVALGRGAPIDGGEEHFAVFSLVRQGHRAAHCPGAVVHHSGPATLREWRARHIQTLAAATAYMTLLLCEADGYRGALLKYLWCFLRRTHRSWRPRRFPLGAEIVPRWRVVLALLRGPCLYVGARWKAGERLTNLTHSEAAHRAMASQTPFRVSPDPSSQADAR